eukprot:gene7476-10096_t
MDWNFYASFREVMRQGSLSAAARTLGLTQPTLGRHVAALEAELGVALFTRSPQGLTPTSAAADLLPRVEAMHAAAHAVPRDRRDIARQRVDQLVGVHRSLPRMRAANALS